MNESVAITITIIFFSDILQGYDVPPPPPPALTWFCSVELNIATLASLVNCMSYARSVLVKLSILSRSRGAEIVWEEKGVQRSLVL